MPRPDICIGADEYHTPQKLTDIIKLQFESLGYSVEINSPFSGSIVPSKYYKQDKRVVSIMIEVNRKLYMNEETFLKSKQFNTISKKISRAAITAINNYYNQTL